jgi:tripartite-type tricarboxylate transporter receptor subunit TctC
LLTNNTFVINPQVRKLNYRPLTDFEPVCRLVSVPILLVVNSSSSHRTLADLLDAARTRPGALTLGSVTASVSHLNFERLKRVANVNMTFVPYPGSAPAVSALLGDHLTAVSADYPSMAEQVRAGKLRALATPAPKRIEMMSDVPTIAESGFKDFTDGLWNGLLAPAKTPQDMISQLIGWFAAAMQEPEIKAKLLAQGQLPDVVCGTDFGAHLRKQYDDYGRIIREANVKAD